jgi:hypothetical protein
MPEGLKWWLYDRCDEARQAVNAHKFLISSVRRIPPEIWGAIFLQCLSQGSFSVPDVSKAPLLFGRVCGFWRRISVSTPALWSTLSVDFTTRSWASSESLIRTWLSRSGACPLSLSVHNGEDESRYDQIMSLFGPHSAQYRTLTLRMSSLCTHGLLRTPKSMPSLESVTIQVTKDFILPIWISSSVPNLREVTLLPFDLYMYAQDLPNIPWHQLTRIQFHARLDVSRCLDILGQTPNLLHACFRLYGNPVPSRDPICLPVLRSLKLVADKALDNVLDSLILPSVRTIAIDARCDWPVDRRPFHIWPKLQLIALIERSSCPLERLTLYEKIITEDELMELAGKLPPSLLQGHLIVFCGTKNLVTDRVRNALPQGNTSSVIGTMKRVGT